MQALSRLWASGFGERLANQIKVLEPSCTAFSIMSPSGQNRFLTQNPRGAPAETAHPADPVQWLQRRSRAERGTRGREGAIPYTTLKEPEPWSVIHARLMVHAVRNRPQNKRRMVWDRHIAREKQKMVRVSKCRNQQFVGNLAAVSVGLARGIIWCTLNDDDASPPRQLVVHVTTLVHPCHCRPACTAPAQVTRFCRKMRGRYNTTAGAISSSQSVTRTFDGRLVARCRPQKTTVAMLTRNRNTSSDSARAR